MWFGLENMLVSYADDATLLEHIPSSNTRSDVTESLNRDLSKISTWCNLWGIRLKPNKTQSMIVSRSRTVFPPHPDLLVGSTSPNSCEFFKILGVMFDGKFTFERHIRSISSSVAQRLVYLENPLESSESFKEARERRRTGSERFLSGRERPAIPGAESFKEGRERARVSETWQEGSVDFLFLLFRTEVIVHICANNYTTILDSEQ